jgi:hypothetical protein
MISERPAHELVPIALGIESVLHADDVHAGEGKPVYGLRKIALTTRQARDVHDQ